MSKSPRRRKLKQRLFERDGWQHDGVWLAWCAFECGTPLVFDTATIDRYPIAGRDGGIYVAENTRLACEPCNTADGGKYGYGSSEMPHGLSRDERTSWWLGHRLEEADGT